MVSEELIQEALSQANSKEGMDALIHLLLFRVNDTRSETQKLLESSLLRRIVIYVRLKRIRQIIKASYVKERRVPFEEPYVCSEEILSAREDYISAENLLIEITGRAYVDSLKKKWGRQITYTGIKGNKFTYLDKIDESSIQKQLNIETELRRYYSLHSY